MFGAKHMRLSGFTNAEISITPCEKPTELMITDRSPLASDAMRRSQNSIQNCHSVVNGQSAHAKVDYVPLADKLQELKSIRSKRTQNYESKHRPRVFKLMDAQMANTESSKIMSRNSLANFLNSSVKLTDNVVVSKPGSEHGE